MGVELAGISFVPGRQKYHGKQWPIKASMKDFFDEKEVMSSGGSSQYISHLLELGLSQLWGICMLHEVWPKAKLLHRLLEGRGCLSHLSRINDTLGPSKC